MDTSYDPVSYSAALITELNVASSYSFSPSDITVSATNNDGAGTRLSVSINVNAPTGLVAQEAVEVLVAETVPPPPSPHMPIPEIG